MEHRLSPPGRSMVTAAAKISAAGAHSKAGPFKAQSFTTIWPSRRNIPPEQGASTKIFVKIKWKHSGELFLARCYHMQILGILASSRFLAAAWPGNC